jgi:signal transduction histidine kinase
LEGRGIERLLREGPDVTTEPAPIKKLLFATVRYLVLGVLVALACWFSISFTRLTGPVSAIWVAGGLSTGVLLSSERRLWIGYLVAAFTGYLIARIIHGDPWYVILGFSLANILEACVVVFALVYYVGDYNDPAKTKIIGLVSFVGNLCGSAISGVIAASILAIAGSASFVSVLGTWFVAHTLGMAIFATLTAVALHRGRRLFGRPGTRVEFAISLALIAAVCLAVFTHSRYALSFLIYPPLLFCIFRHRFDGVVLGIAVVVIISITLTLISNEHAQLVIGFGETEDVLLLQLFLTVTCLLAFPIAIALTETSVLTNSLRKSEQALARQNTELHAVNEKLAGTQTQLLQSEKMASIGQLAAGVAHEINNPIGYVRSNLTSLSGYLQKIFSVLDAYEQFEKALPTKPSQLAAVDAVKQTAELDYVREDVANLLAESIEGATRVEKIVRDLKDFSHVDQAEWQQADVHGCIDSTLNVVAHELKYKGNLIKEYGDLPLIQCLPFQLKQVFMNLLVNAAHAIAQGGTIAIRTGRDGDYVWITIADTGEGIDPRHISHIFEPFFTTKPVGAGTGLGLSVSYSIIKRHSGTLDVVSEVGKGTTFTIRLPIIAPMLLAEDHGAQALNPAV